MTVTQRAIAALAAAAAQSAFALLNGLPAADATKTITVPARVTIANKGLTFGGYVFAGKTACIKGRKVTLYRTPSQVLGSATTNGSGAWRLSVPGSAGITLGHFYARVKQRSTGAARTVYVCKAATSKTIRYKP